MAALSRPPVSRVTFGDREASQTEESSMLAAAYNGEELRSLPPHPATPRLEEESQPLPTLTNAAIAKGEGLVADSNSRGVQGHTMSPMTGLGVHPSFFSSTLMAQQLPPLAGSLKKLERRFETG